MATDVVLVGGVPGAGKTTALRALAEQEGARVLDPEDLRDWFAAHWPTVPYRRYRSLVHVVQTLRVLTALLAGPRDGRPLFVHDPSTRSRRRVGFARLARSRGWRPTLVLIDVSEGSARQGQLRRGRVVERACFEGHWRRWESLRTEVAGAGLRDRDQWHRVVMTERADALHVLRALTAGELVTAA